MSLRKQEIADRLNAWIIFNEKNRELCEWLTQMENKVAHSAELSIEEMVEKLKKVRSPINRLRLNVLSDPVFHCILLNRNSKLMFFPHLFAFICLQYFMFRLML